MKMSIVFEDGVIVLDNSDQRDFDFSNVGSNWRALQWKDSSGWIEVHSGDRLWLSDFSNCYDFLTLFNQTDNPLANKYKSDGTDWTPNTDWVDPATLEDDQPLP